MREGGRKRKRERSKRETENTKQKRRRREEKNDLKERNFVGEAGEDLGKREER